MLSLTENNSPILTASSELTKKSLFLSSDSKDTLENRVCSGLLKLKVTFV